MKDLKKKILDGKIFIYPTDTIYGIGCNAKNEKSVNKIREIKKRDEKPFSVIAPSFEWVYDNLIVDFDLKKYLPGAYTLVLKKKNPYFLKWVSSGDSLGVRIPNSKFCEEVRKTKVPFITTSVNLSGENFALNLKDIKKEILNNVDIVIKSEEKLSGIPSKIVINGKEIKR